MSKETYLQDFCVTPELFLEWRSPRFGTSNPTRMDNKVWECITDRQWTRWLVQRKDGRPHHLWQISQAVMEEGYGMRHYFEKSMAALKDALGSEIDLEIAKQLYQPALPHQKIEEEEERYNVRRILVDGVVVRYVEDFNTVQVTIEGDLAEEKVELLKADLLGKLGMLENGEWEVVEI